MKQIALVDTKDRIIRYATKLDIIEYKNFQVTDWVFAGKLAYGSERKD